MKLEQHMGFLQILEMNLEARKDNKKVKRIAFQAESRLEETESLGDEVENLIESLALLSKNFDKVIKMMNKGNKSGPKSRMLAVV